MYPQDFRAASRLDVAFLILLTLQLTARLAYIKAETFQRSVSVSLPAK